MRGAAREQGARRRAAEPSLHSFARLQTEEAEACHSQWVTRNANRAKDIREEILMLTHERCHQVDPSRAILAEVVAHFGEPAGQHGC
jgi:hypothetical protein